MRLLTSILGGAAYFWVAMCVAAVVLSDSQPSSAQAAPLKEQDLFQRWLERSPEVASWSKRVGQAEFDVVTAGLLPNPTLGLNGSAVLHGLPPDGKVNWGAQVSMPLPLFGQIGARRTAARQSLSLAQLSLLALLRERAHELRLLMVDRAFAQAKVAMLTGNQAELSRIAKVVELRTAAGSNSAYDVLRVQATVATLRAAIRDAAIDRDQAEARLLALIADPSLRAAPLTRESLSAFRGPENESQLQALAMKRRADLALALRGVDASRAEVERFKREAWPLPSLMLGGYRTEHQPSWSVVGGVSFELPTFDRNQGVIGRARVEGEGQRLLVDALRYRISTEVHGAWVARDHARQALERFQREGVEPMADLIKRAEVTYQAGKFSIVDLLDSYRTMWEARTQALDLEREKADAEAELERAVGLVP